MSKSGKTKRGDHQPAAAQQRGRRSIWLAGCGLLFLAALVTLALLPDRRSLRPRRATPTSTTPSSTATSTTSTASKSGTSSTSPGTADPHHGGEIQLEALRKVVGRWKRSDADYVLKVKSVDAQGKLDAVYLNPQSIHVARAEAHSHGENAHLTIELRDVNYPGCLYDLNYDPAQDRLTGTYFQAALGETYDVTFERSE